MSPQSAFRVSSKWIESRTLTSERLTGIYLARLERFDLKLRAEPYRDRVPTLDAAIVRRLRDAGAVLVAKLSMGALALNDIWFGGKP